MINVALRQMNLTESCVSTWISQEGNYGFVEFRSADEATRALNSLSSVQILGQQLKVGRPTQYIQQDKTTNPQAKPAVTTGFNQNGQLDILNLLNPGQILPNTLENTAIIQSPVDNQNIINTPNNILNNLNPVANFANSILLNGSLQQPIIPQINTQTNIPLVQNATLSGIPGLDPSKQIPSQIINIKIQVPTQVLVLKNMINDGELIIDEEYKQIEEDVKDECSKHGKVVSIAIPRPSVDDVKAGKEHVLGKGKIYVEYESIEAAREARRYLNGRLFSNRTVQVSYFNYQKYLEQDYDYQIK
ncbi:u2 small nuclear ribonucleoprotein auxiliary factor 2, putative [Ichthyophthirius multifiliis]|uniref:U2 small nuclear ribonucleoprotein auxiliary factor 2, putative n=1 Tax=Ichthyophthirius multifiliis TaxID=5932 RepID=G0QP50_ICHMU|nr:u2 small nuclear ribonucleoprotein auxiliary factor 2, putative [Ichthyophthirius multifiliis]EGR33003.1 u2 small nuclear ribonucleoprotein auxiliary factor 2, putative [Ichthyophthirius multifiliis]|eukprot:XP_004036989.1 u2 small nuclear ribonucleoprotein auxiliary factor 2, putative [Ichthyophthirius multifiliis]